MWRAFLCFTVSMVVPALAGELVVNGSFETGSFSGWTVTTTGTPFLPWLVSPAGAGAGFGMQPTMPQSGMLDAWNGFDGEGPMHFTLSQQVAIPRCSASAITIAWKDRIQWNFAITFSATQPRTYTVRIQPATGSPTTLYSFSTGIEHNIGDTGWQSHSVDLSAFAGSTVQLVFDEFVPELFTGPAQFEIDDVSISASTFVSLDNRCTTVRDRVIDSATGLTLQQYFSGLADQCTTSARNHGDFVSCMSRALNDAKRLAISGQEKGALTSVAAQTSRGKKY